MMLAAQRRVKRTDAEKLNPPVKAVPQEKADTLICPHRLHRPMEIPPPR